ncbi:MAG: hypothetical protein K9I85_15780 [Saprospiraceae bacterium]|nr:hypothetical protein [Saprospiraceae bacterium]
MGFAPITIDKYVKMHLKNNPSCKEVDVRKALHSAINAHNKGMKCSCGNDIWVIGSAFAGNSCFTCITGESFPTDDYEIDTVLKKRANKKGRRHIDDMDPTKIAGIFDDDGYEINTDLIQKPSLCLICKNNDSQEEEIFCNLTRYDQKDEPEFTCFAFVKK